MEMNKLKKIYENAKSKYKENDPVLWVATHVNKQSKELMKWQPDDAEITDKLIGKVLRYYILCFGIHKSFETKDLVRKFHITQEQAEKIFDKMNELQMFQSVEEIK